jgi:type IV pilus assembly protein PilV
MHITTCRAATPRRVAGFSLLEVLVTIVILSLGFLGLTKMQAASISNTQTSRVRTLLALQAGSLGAMMRGNKAYWGAAPPASFRVSQGNIIESTSVLTAAANCSGTSTCTSAQMAAFDVQAWAANLNARFPGTNATVACNPATVGPDTPANCRITLDWTEKYVAINRSTAASGATLTGTQTFTLYVEP